MPLTAESALRKDRLNARAPVMEHRHFAVVAGVIAKLSCDVRLDIARHFANELAATNPRFNRHRFLRACNVLVLS